MVEGYSCGKTKPSFILRSCIAVLTRAAAGSLHQPRNKYQNKPEDDYQQQERIDHTRKDFSRMSHEFFVKE